MWTPKDTQGKGEAHVGEQRTSNSQERQGQSSTPLQTERGTITISDVVVKKVAGLAPITPLLKARPASLLRRTPATHQKDKRTTFGAFYNYPRASPIAPDAWSPIEGR